MTSLRLPLRLDHGPHGLGRGILDADGRQVAFVACHTASLARTPDDGPPIAAAIVRAVNAHDELIALLRTIHANAAESPEWIRARTGPVLARLDADTPR